MLFLIKNLHIQKKSSTFAVKKNITTLWIVQIGMPYGRCPPKKSVE